MMGDLHLLKTESKSFSLTAHPVAVPVKWKRKEPDGELVTFSVNEMAKKTKLMSFYR